MSRHLLLPCRSMLLALAVPLMAVGCAARPGGTRDAARGVSAAPAHEARFPDDWLGSWSGEVTPYAADGAKERFSMRLDIARTDDPARFEWTITYSGAAGTQVRAYTLLVRDAASGRYAIDEGNGIVLGQQLLADAFYSWFDIGGSRLCVRERLVRGIERDADRIEVEIASARDRDAVSTGASGEVSCRPLVSVQRAELRRVSPGRAAAR